MTRRQSSMDTLVTVALRTRMPALLTRMSIPPKAATVSRAMRSASSGLATSPVTRAAVPPAFSIRRTVSSSSARRRPDTMTRAPSRANSSAVPRPMPVPPPVTSATRGPSLN
jgi:hypothetical protein